MINSLETEKHDFVVVDADEWVTCSPEWLKDHEGQCGKAPRVWSEKLQNHLHPKNWPCK